MELSTMIESKQGYRNYYEEKLTVEIEETERQKSLSEELQQKYQYGEEENDALRQEVSELTEQNAKQQA